MGHKVGRGFCRPDHYQSRIARSTEIQLMFFTKTEPNKPKTIEALIPMIDLFAVLAIVFSDLLER